MSNDYDYEDRWCYPDPDCDWAYARKCCGEVGHPRLANDGHCPCGFTICDDLKNMNL